MPKAIEGGLINGEEEIKTEQIEPEITEEVIDTQEQVETESSPETPVRRRRKRKKKSMGSLSYFINLQ